MDVAILQREYRESGKIVSQLLRPPQSFTNNDLQQQRVEFTHSNVASLTTALVYFGQRVVSTRPGRSLSLDHSILKYSTVPVNLYPRSNGQHRFMHQMLSIGDWLLPGFRKFCGKGLIDS